MATRRPCSVQRLDLDKQAHAQSSQNDVKPLKVVFQTFRDPETLVNLVKTETLTCLPRVNDERSSLYTGSSINRKMLQINVAGHNALTYLASCNVPCLVVFLWLLQVHSLQRANDVD